jgi:hypothetical protein
MASVVVTLADNGRGFDESIRPSVRAVLHDQGGGNGPRLSICYSLVLRTAARSRLRAKPVGGPGLHGHTAGVPDPARRATGDGVAGRMNARVLLIDDEDVFREDPRRCCVRKALSARPRRTARRVCAAPRLMRRT